MQVAISHGARKFELSVVQGAQEGGAAELRISEAGRRWVLDGCVGLWMLRGCFVGECVGAVWVGPVEGIGSREGHAWAARPAGGLPEGDAWGL